MDKVRPKLLSLNRQMENALRLSGFQMQKIDAVCDKLSDGGLLHGVVLDPEELKALLAMMAWPQKSLVLPLDLLRTACLAP